MTKMLSTRKISTGFILKEKEKLAIYQRLKQLAENAKPTDLDKNAGPKGLEQLNKELSKIEAKYPTNDIFQIKHIPTHASGNIHAIKIAQGKPWDGNQSAYDHAVRSITDKEQFKQKSKIIKFKGPTIITPPKSIHDRVYDARENVLDYKLAKNSIAKGNSCANNKDDEWGERYREKLLGPAMLLSDSFANVDNSITSLADQKIMEAQRAGAFKNLPRGKELEDTYNRAENTFIDRTEFQLNKILKRQDALPEWIDKQSSVDLQVQKWREELYQDWKKWRMNRSNVPLAKEEFSETNKGKIKENIRWLNDKIRGYNLQAPLPSQKIYLLFDKELERCYKRVSENSNVEVNENENENKNKLKVAKWGDIPQRNHWQRPSESLTSMIMQIFKKK
ncbi:hypothetical protein DAMA08_017970 [Martiniozyma asiatica (nom. inval.)]|nr:hypothetical protein DAMA08_017970 [Martiniozyma asiatica]